MTIKEYLSTLYNVDEITELRDIEYWWGILPNYKKEGFYSWVDVYGSGNLKSEDEWDRKELISKQEAIRRLNLSTIKFHPKRRR